VIQLHEYKPHKEAAATLEAPCGHDTRKIGFLMQVHSTRTPSFPENLQDYAPWVSIHGLVAPYGKCQCGCDADAPISLVTRYKVGYAKGQPQRCLAGHKTTFVDEPNPSGLCQCGCGLPTLIAKQTNSKTGDLRGKPLRYLYGHYHKTLRSTEEMFWDKVCKGEPDDCWLWASGRNEKGYGKFVMRHEDFGCHDYAHRIAYILTYGPIPDGHYVCHKCDNPPCCNPFHLFAGTRQDNVDDMLSKKRQAYGDRAGQSKLRECEVVEIIALLHKGAVMHKDIAAQFGVSRFMVGDIWRGQTWRHVPRPWDSHYDARNRFRFGGQK
jgi:hypothetical protein